MLSLDWKKKFVVPLKSLKFVLYPLIVTEIVSPIPDDDGDMKLIYGGDGSIVIELVDNISPNVISLITKSQLPKFTPISGLKSACIIPSE